MLLRAEGGRVVEVELPVEPFDTLRLEYPFVFELVDADSETGLTPERTAPFMEELNGREV